MSEDREYRSVGAFVTVNNGIRAKKLTACHQVGFFWEELLA
jgi:hypothetical protein